MGLEGAISSVFVSLVKLTDGGNSTTVALATFAVFMGLVSVLGGFVESPLVGSSFLELCQASLTTGSFVLSTWGVEIEGWFSSPVGWLVSVWALMLVLESSSFFRLVVDSKVFKSVYCCVVVLTVVFLFLYVPDFYCSQYAKVRLDRRTAYGCYYHTMSWWSGWLLVASCWMIVKRLFGKEFSSDVTGDGPETVEDYVVMIYDMLQQGFANPSVCPMTIMSLEEYLANGVTFSLEWFDELSLECMVGINGDIIQCDHDNAKLPVRRFGFCNIHLDSNMQHVFPNIVSFLSLINNTSGLMRNHVQYFNEEKFTVGMIGRGVINRGAARRGGNQYGPPPAGHANHVPPAQANAIAAALGAPGPDQGLQAPAPPVEELEPPLPAWNREWKAIEGEFIHSDFPRTRCQFDLSELHKYGKDSVLLDPIGDPFCGLTAIDLAVGVQPKVDVYLKRCKYKPTKFSLGSNVELRKWAHYRGVNLRFIVPLVGQPDQVFDYCNNVRWKWVILVVKDNNGDTLFVLDEDAINHAYLVVDESADRSNLELPQAVVGNFPIMEILLNFFFSLIVSRSIMSIIMAVGAQFAPVGYPKSHPEYLGWKFTWTSFFLRVVILNNLHVIDYGFELPNWVTLLLPWLDECVYLFYNFNKIFHFSKKWDLLETRYNQINDDHRNIRNRRDKADSQETYAYMEEITYLWFFNIPILPLRYLGLDRKRLVSVTRAVQLITEMQLSDPENLSTSLLSLLKSNYSNTNDSLGGIYLDTSAYVQHYISTLKYESNVHLEHTTAYSAQGSAAYLGNLLIAGYNQFSLQVGGGHWAVDKKGDKLYLPGGNLNNGFKKLKTSVLKPVAKKVVSYAPLGSLTTNVGQVGPGNICVTEPCGLFAALVGRSMAKLPVSGLEGFKKFAEKEIKRLVDQVDIGGFVVDKDVMRCFEKNNKGKRSAKFIANRLRQYDNFVNKGIKNKKFFKNSCFVKFEDSTKLVNGESRVRPRLIMTMSDYDSVKLSPLIQLIDRWNHSAFGKHQIKGVDPTQFNDRIAEFCDRVHISTDYSAFEGSVSGVFKSVEALLIHLLCDKYECGELKRSFKKLNKFGRELDCEIGTFVISSRCSGDYITSTFNCLINYLINAYSAHKLGLDHTKLDLLVEGDDGLTKPSQIDVGLINSLGFDFSANLRGSKAGDVDFLRKRWLLQGTLISVGRTLRNLFWVNSQPKISLARQKAILRAKALSYHSTSPGHPVVCSAINYILEKTSGYNKFKGIEKFMYGGPELIDLEKMGRNIGQVPIREELRGLIADGASGFQGIPITTQLHLEKQFRKGNFFVSSILNGYDEIEQSNCNTEWKTSELRGLSKEIADNIEALTMDPVDYQAKHFPDLIANIAEISKKLPTY